MTDTFAHYNLVRIVGRGGMSTVYEAVDRRMGRRVAVKVLAPPFGSTHDDVQALRSRMMREARAIAALSHPNIVTIYDVGTENGQDYLVMEYLQGETLRERMKGTPRPLAEVSGVLSQVAAALDTVHAAGIVHRDLKPSNIMILPGGQVKLMDFGVARHQDDTMVTQVGMIVGTPTFMAPEQIRGELGTGSSDIWALGILTYQMIAGRLPFPGKHIPAILHQVAFDDPPPIEGIPHAVQDVIDRALQKDPATRYATATEMAAAFAAAIAPGAPPITEPIAPALLAEQDEDTPTVPALANDNPNAPRIPRPLPARSARARHGAQVSALLILAALAFAGVYAMTTHLNRPADRTPAQHEVGHRALPAKGAQSGQKSVTAAAAPSHPNAHGALLLHRQSAHAISTGASDRPTAVAATPRDSVSEADRHPEAAPSAARRTPKAHGSAKPRTVADALAHPVRRTTPHIVASVPDETAYTRDVSDEDDQADNGTSEDTPRSTRRSGVAGVWRGRIWHNPATLTVYPHTGSDFTGSLSVRTPEGRVRVAVTGQVSKSGEVTIHENRVTSAERPRSWDLGDYTGRLDDNGMQGSGHDVRGRNYPWSMSR